jgi:hypothetical protein
VFLPEPSKSVERLNVKDRKTSIGNNLKKNKKNVGNYDKRKKAHLGCSLPQLPLESQFTFFATAGSHRIPEFQKLVGR